MLETNRDLVLVPDQQAHDQDQTVKGHVLVVVGHVLIVH